MFEGIITQDAGIQYEQNLTDLPIAVAILHALSNDIVYIRPLSPALLNDLANLTPRELVHVRF